MKEKLTIEEILMVMYAICFTLIIIITPIVLIWVLVNILAG